jgi:DNA-binding XRE family transcriptional regulator
MEENTATGLSYKMGDTSKNINLSETGDNRSSNKESRIDSFFLANDVKKHRNDALKIRLKTLISAKGLSQADFYKSLGLSKDYWYLLSYGKMVCPLDIKVRIAQALGVDSSVIWQESSK